MSKDKHHISFIKGVTWRIVGTLDTMMLSYIFTGSIGNALKIGITEVFTKIGLFYLHERIWFLIKWGTTLNETDETLIDSNIYDENKKAVLKETHTRSIVKGISWRIVGTIDTIIIAFFWTGDYTKALKIGFTDVIAKVLLYYLHERIWMKLTRK